MNAGGVEHRPVMLDQARLVAAGWSQTRSNRWKHAAFPGALGRARLFTLNDALALLDADPSAGSATMM